MVVEDGLTGFKELQPANIVAELVGYIGEKLPDFPYSSEFIDILQMKKNENQHSLSFCVYMTNECSSKYYFARENAQAGSSVVDIGVYKGSVLIFTIEAKLLPTPKGTKKNPRIAHEYVFGPGAGIQRFRDGKHGLDNLNNLLSESGLIGFIKENDEQFWFKQINAWIEEASWGSAERLNSINSNDFRNHLSKHKRYNNSEIVLYHFFVAVKP
jgi:hypothetical protein